MNEERGEVREGGDFCKWNRLGGSHSLTWCPKRMNVSQKDG